MASKLGVVVFFAGLAAPWLIYGSVFLEKVLPQLQSGKLVAALDGALLEQYYGEMLLAAFILVFLVYMTIGKTKNQRLALTWTDYLTAPDGVLSKNFALIGTGTTSSNTQLVKYSSDCFKLHASGRRFCQGALVTFQLQPRQDLISSVISTLWVGTKDTLEVQIAMNEGVMAPLALMIGSIATVKAKYEQHQDLGTYTKKFEVTKDRLASWPSDRLAIAAEQASVFYDLMTPQVMDLAFGPQAFVIIKPYFKYLHITSDFAEGGATQTIRLGMTLPAYKDRAVVDRMLQLCMLMTDMIGAYKLTPEQSKRAQDARAKKAAEVKPEDAEERERRAEERRKAKEAEEKERLKRMTPAQREKEKQRKEKILRNRAMRSMTKMK